MEKKPSSKKDSSKILEGIIRKLVKEEMGNPKKSLKEEEFKFKGYSIKQLIQLVDNVLEGDSADRYQHLPAAKAAYQKMQQSEKTLQQLGLVGSDGEFLFYKLIKKYPEFQKIEDFLEERGL